MFFLLDVAVVISLMNSAGQAIRRELLCSTKV